MRVRPTPNTDPTLKDIAPLAIPYFKETLYPNFQCDARGMMYRNIATCIKVFRNADPPPSDMDILIWFFCPNESLDGRTPAEVGRNPDEEIRREIILAAELDEPLAPVASTWS
ncbi:MAG TPA: hypothetical protein VLB83_02190 [Candidatus Paceibacterota bacterium]|nr:hypothetical protein [Candidatus Paceibacterota bacterium]